MSTQDKTYTPYKSPNRSRDVGRDFLTGLIAINKLEIYQVAERFSWIDRSGLLEIRADLDWELSGGGTMQIFSRALALDGVAAHEFRHYATEQAIRSPNQLPILAIYRPTADSWIAKAFTMVRPLHRGRFN